MDNYEKVLEHSIPELMDTIHGWLMDYWWLMDNWSNQCMVGWASKQPINYFSCLTLIVFPKFWRRLRCTNLCIYIYIHTYNYKYSIIFWHSIRTCSDMHSDNMDCRASFADGIIIIWCFFCVEHTDADVFAGKVMCGRLIPSRWVFWWSFETTKRTIAPWILALGEAKKVVKWNNYPLVN